MTPRSRTGKLMQGLFGRFGKNQQAVVDSANLRSPMTESPADIEFDEFPISGESDDEETNWDDVEALGDNQEMVYPQPVMPIEPSVKPTIPDVDEWDEALPAATVKTSNTQEARRGKTSVSAPSTSKDLQDDRPNYSLPAQAIDLWAKVIQQFRRILPVPVQQISDTILTAILVTIVTIAIWRIDGFFATPSPAQVAITKNAPVTTTPIQAELGTNPEQAFIDAIQTKFSDLDHDYPEGIIQALQVDLPQDLVIVRVNPSWYSIDDAQQDSITDRMWVQARSNHFRKLELQDITGRSIARSPIVGQHMVILQRRENLGVS